jgi:chemotaxis protein MotB
LTKLLPVLAGKPNVIEIRAHSSRRPLPSDSPFADHWALCYARSSAAMRFLEQRGIELRRLRLSQASPHEPISARLETDWQSQNDCIEVFLLTEVVEGQPGREEAPLSKPTPNDRSAKPAGQNDPPSSDSSDHH